MARDMVPVLKRCRSLGLEPEFVGIHKESKRKQIRGTRKKSEYGLQLTEKQKAKFIYGVLEKPFRNYFAKASQMKGQTGENLMVMLESRLDNVIFRLGFARTRREARQFVSHGHFTVDGRCVNIPSFQVKPGMVIGVKGKSKEIERIKGFMSDENFRGLPKWLTYDAEKGEGTVVAMPARDDLDFEVEEHLIVEFYSK